MMKILNNIFNSNERDSKLRKNEVELNKRLSELPFYEGQTFNGVGPAVFVEVQQSVIITEDKAAQVYEAMKEAIYDGIHKYEICEMLTKKFSELHLTCYMASDGMNCYCKVVCINSLPERLIPKKEWHINLFGWLFKDACAQL